MNQKHQTDIGKMLYGLYTSSSEMIEQLKDKKAFIESNMYQISGVDYSKIRGSNGNREKVLLNQLEQKDKIDKRINLLTLLQENVDELLVLMIDEELTPYVVNKEKVDMEAVMDECGFSERTAYRKLDNWYNKLVANMLQGK